MLRASPHHQRRRETAQPLFATFEAAVANCVSRAQVCVFCSGPANGETTEANDQSGQEPSHADVGVGTQNSGANAIDCDDSVRRTTALIGKRGEATSAWISKPASLRCNGSIAPHHPPANHAADAGESGHAPSALRDSSRSLVLDGRSATGRNSRSRSHEGPRGRPCVRRSEDRHRGRLPADLVIAPGPGADDLVRWRLAHAENRNRGR